MTQSERVLEFIRRFPGRNDDEASRTLGILPRQTINQICRTLVKRGLIERRMGDSGKLSNFPTLQSVATADAKGGKDLPPPRPIASGAATDDWFWEGNVTNSLARYLVHQGWKVLSQADTLSKAQGLDLHVARAGQELVIEVKGYPSTGYRDPRRAGEAKPTNPSAQASHWFSHALLKVLRLRAKHPTARAFMAFPDFPRYRGLFNEIASSLKELGVGVFFVRHDATIETSDPSILS